MAEQKPGTEQKFTILPRNGEKDDLKIIVHDGPAAKEAANKIIDKLSARNTIPALFLPDENGDRLIFVSARRAKAAGLTDEKATKLCKDAIAELPAPKKHEQQDTQNQLREALGTDGQFDTLIKKMHAAVNIVFAGDPGYGPAAPKETVILASAQPTARK